MSDNTSVQALIQARSNPTCDPKRSLIWQAYLRLDLHVPFELEFRRNWSFDDFAATLLAEHLNKTREEKGRGEKIETCFVPDGSKSKVGEGYRKGN